MNKKVKILIIEDERTITKALKGELEREGYEVDTALEGEEGFKKCLEGAPNLVLLDILLPRMHGFEILRKMKENDKTKNITVLVLSNLNQKADIEKGLKLGAKEFLTKANANLSDIMGKVKQYIG